MITIQRDSAAPFITVELQGVVDIRSAAELHRHLCDLSLEGRCLIVDGSQLDVLDTACAQILIAARQSLKSDIQIRIDRASEAGRAIAESGLWNHLMGEHTVEVATLN